MHSRAVLRKSTGHHGKEPEQQHRPSQRQNTSGRYVWEATVFSEGAWRSTPLSPFDVQAAAVGSGGRMGEAGWSVWSISSVWLVSFLELEKLDEPKKPEEPDRPDEPDRREEITEFLSTEERS